MEKLWQTRLRKHQKEQAKYLQRVFNDHFVLVLLVLFGALLYAYSNFVQKIAGHPLWVDVLVAAIVAVTLPLGRLATLLVPADAVFLLPKTGALTGYLNQARRYSLMLPFALQIVVSVAVWPLMTIGGNPNLALMGALIVQQLVLAYANMSSRLTALFVPRWHQARWLLCGVDFALLLIGQLTWFIPVAVIGAAFGAILTYRSIAARKHQSFALLLGIETEKARMGAIYRFYNLFTDVPGLGGGVVRRAYLDFLLKRIPVRQVNTWEYLLMRGLLRSHEYFDLCVRLVIVGMLAIWLSPTWWLALIINLAFSYLLGYQLLPLATRYNEIVFTHIYPVNPDACKMAWQKIVHGVLLVQALILGLTAIVHLHNWFSLLVLSAGLLFVPVLVHGYLKWRIAD